MKIALIIIGDEVLLGQVVDTNATSIARILYKEGLEIYKKWTVADKSDQILLALHEASQDADVLLMTGGLGPTKDDITKKTLADYFEVDLIFSDENKIHLEKMLQIRNMKITPNHLQQCYLPANAILLDNQLGTALGMYIKAHSKMYFSMPGVPYEMEFIMNHGVVPRLRENKQNIQVYHQTIHTIGMGETEIADLIEPKFGELPSYLSLAYLPSQGQVKLRLTGKHESLDFLKEKIETYKEIIKDTLIDNILGFGDTSLEEEIGKLLIKQERTLSTAESCSGGYLAHKIVSVPGASEYFQGSIVAYQYEMKHKLLGVSEEVLAKFGAVSEECVVEMVKGACSELDSNYAIATSGIAGPLGGTEDKPVGTVWIAYGTKDTIKTKKLRFFRDRIRNIEATATFAMILFWKYLKEVK
ncbi:MAG: CinA family nicotinamide mononucleotide deamidase-related protein [Saprospiraceae bacterium]|nr:CinA family nicotinamide mononucleotide deamidase-related protein [Saprospiraceae bacterium]